MCHGHFLAGEFALHHVEPVQQVRIAQQCLTIPLLGQLDDKGEGGIVERHGRGAGHRPWHVGDTVVHHLIDDIGRILVGGGVSYQAAREAAGGLARLGIPLMTTWNGFDR